MRRRLTARRVLLVGLAILTGVAFLFIYSVHHRTLSKSLQASPPKFSFYEGKSPEDARTGVTVNLAAIDDLGKRIDNANFAAEVSDDSGFRKKTGAEVNEMRPLQTGAEVKEMRPLETGAEVKEIHPLETGAAVKEMRPMETGSEVKEIRPLETGSRVKEMRPVGTVAAELPAPNRISELNKLREKAQSVKTVYVPPEFKYSNDVYFSPPRFGPVRNLSNYLINPVHVCSTVSVQSSTDSVFLMVLVLSSYLNNAARERAVIRATYGSVTRGRPWPRGKPLATPVRMVFLLGAPPTLHDRQSVESESAQYGDLLVADFVDSYNNLTLKVLHGLHWVVQHCPQVKFILKADDDVFINLPLLTMFLVNRGLPNSIYGHTYFQAKVVRGKGRWAVNRTVYALPVYPVYVSGTAYVMSTDAAQKIVNTSHRLPLLPIEDAFITGILAQISQVSRFQCKGFTSFAEKQPHVCSFFNEKLFAGNRMHAVEKTTTWILLKSAEVVQMCRTGDM